MTTTPITTDVVVIGGGPSGSAAAHVLATAGHHVTIVERQRYPRPKTCGDALSPRAVAELAHLGITDDDLDRFHRVTGVRLVAGRRTEERPWPAHPVFGSHGYVARRDQLDAMTVGRAVHAGATLLESHDALRPIVERGFVRGADVVDDTGRSLGIRARYLLVADGANSRFGRALGTFRQRSWPYATTIRSYWSTPLHATRSVEASFDLRDRDGTALTGYGWVFPVGDGTANVGVGVLSTSHEFRSVNSTELLDRFVHDLADRWQLDPTAPLARPVSGRIPMGASVGPSAGPAHLVVGDAAGAANPLTGAGIEYALGTGRLAGEVLAEALASNDPTALQQYPTRLADAFGTHFKVGRLLDRFAGRPSVMRRAGRAMVGGPRAADMAMRIGLDELRPDRVGSAEIAYRLARTVTRFAPNA